MSFISYAQNFEDVMLWRALRHIENGTYVDVGAQDPVVDSVSKAFHEHGWRGVHIEPVPFYANLLRQNRPDEIVLEAALGQSEGTLTLNVIPGTGLSTAVDAHADRHSDAGFTAQPVVVPMLTINKALHMLAGRDIHWLKIDVEGFEKEVLLGWDSALLRPWVLVVEATIPGSDKPDFADWEPIVLAAGYQFVYFDGLNRFYVAQEHAELAAAFASPPNVFDDVQLSGQGSWGLYRRVLAEQQERLTTAVTEIEILNLKSDAVMLAEQETTVSRLRAELNALREEAAAAVDDLAKERANGQSERVVLNRQMKDVWSRYELLASRYGELQCSVTRLAEKNAASEKRVADSQAEIHEWWSTADRLNRELSGVYASRSWRLTQQIQLFVGRVRGMRQLPARGLRFAKRRSRAAVRTAAVGSLRVVLARPGLRVRLAQTLARYPHLKQALRRLAGNAGLLSGTAVPAVPAMAAPDGATVPLNSRAMRIYGQLKNNQNGNS